MSSAPQHNEVIVKAYYNDLAENQPDIRRFVIDVTPNNDTFQILETTISQLNSEYPQGQFTLQYIDEDNDRITFSSDGEFRSALRQLSAGSTMKIYVKPKAKKAESTNNNTVHNGITCDGCQGPVVGNRYKCLECPDYDLCQSCSDKNLHPEHNMMKLTRPGHHPFGGFRRCGRGPFGGAGRCGAGPRFWRHFMHQQQQQQQRPGEFAASFPMSSDMANFLGQFKGKELAELIEAHLPPFLRSEKVTEMLNQFKSGEQAEKPVDQNVLLENVGQFLRDVLSPFGIDCDYFVEKGESKKPTEQTETSQEKKEQPTAAPTAPTAEASASTEPKPTPPPTFGTASASASAAPFGNLLEQLQTMFQPMFNQAATASSNSTTTAPPTVDPQLQEQKKIEECVERMTAMGFVDSNGILTDLIKAKKGDLNQVLDALNPRNYKN